MTNSATVQYNPTATAIQFNGENADQVNEVMSKFTGRKQDFKPVKDMYYVAFMGTVHILTEAQFMATRGIV